MNPRGTTLFNLLLGYAPIPEPVTLSIPDNPYKVRVTLGEMTYAFAYIQSIAVEDDPSVGGKYYTMHKPNGYTQYKFGLANLDKYITLHSTVSVMPLYQKTPEMLLRYVLYYVAVMRQAEKEQSIYQYARFRDGYPDEDWVKLSYRQELDYRQFWKDCGVDNDQINTMMYANYQVIMDMINE